MPPLIVNPPEMIEAVAIDKVPLERLNVVWADDIVKLLTESDVFELCVMVMPLMSISGHRPTRSARGGRWHRCN